MALINFLKQTCTIVSSSGATIVEGSISPGTSTLFTDIPCFLYEDKKGFNQNERAIEDQNGKMTIAIEIDKTGIKIHDTVTVTDPDIGNLGDYRVERVDIHRSFTGIGAISLSVTKIKDGEDG